MKANTAELQSSTENQSSKGSQSLTEKQSLYDNMPGANYNAGSPPVSNDSSTAVKAINSNTFVVKLKSCENNQTKPAPNETKTHVDTSQELSPIPSLLQLVQGSNKNKSGLQIKTLGTHKIILNKPMKPTLQVHARPAGNSITIIKPNGIGNLPIIKRFPKSAYQSLITLNNLRTKENEGKENHRNNNFNKNMIWPTNGNGCSKFTFSLDSFSCIKKELPKYQQSIQIKLPELRPVSPLKSVDENSKPELNEFLDDDGDLTNLSWLSNGKNPLKAIPNPDEFGIFSDEDDDKKDVKISANSVFTATSKVEGNLSKYAAPRYDQTQEYNPNGKPPYSFSCLIFMAIEDSFEKKLPVKAIYNWVCKHFPYFFTAPPGWKNSIRHNLSLNKCFKKADPEQGMKDPAKGSLWCIDPAYRPNLIQALKRTSFYPYIHPSGIGQPLSLSNLANLLPGAQSGRIPLWSPNLTANKPYSNADPDVADAALNLLGLKAKDDDRTQNIRNTIKELQKEILERGCWPCPWNDSLTRSESCSSLDSSEDGIIVSRDSSDDHNYTKPFKYLVETQNSETPLSPESDKSAPDAAYEFETGGTDEEYFDDIAVDREEEIVTSDSDDLMDSGFGANKDKLRLRPPSRKRKRRDSCAKTKTDKAKKMKVKMGPKSRKNEAKTPPKNKKNVYSSDGDSGKDSPKVVRSRSYKRKIVATPVELRNEYKKTYNNQLMRHRTKGTYSTRSTSISRYSTRSAGKKAHENSEGRTRRSVGHYSGALSNDDEEIKLAAGSLMHLAGFKSPTTAMVS